MRRRSSRRARTRSGPISSPEPGATEVLRRAPFSTNPRVGARGQRTQQRILDAALAVFGEVGYHGGSVDRITKAAGCSRVSFYQYFSSKEDVFRHLAGEVARRLGASTEALEPVTPEPEGWASLRAWAGRHAEIHARYQPVFATYPAAAASDEAVAGGAGRTGRRHAAQFRGRLTATTVPARQQHAVVSLLLECVSRTFDIAALLRAAAPRHYEAGRVADAVTDVAHRTLFGLDTTVNVHAPAAGRPPALGFGPLLSRVRRHSDDGRTPASQRTHDALLAAGREEFVRRGYHGTRVDDIAAAAGISHGAFYRYFDNKDELVHVLAVRAMRTVSTAFADIPAESTDGALRTWLRRYHAAHATEAAVIRVWADAALEDPGLEADSVAAYDLGRRQMAEFLAPRGFGDDDTEAVVMVALLESFGSQPRDAAAVGAAARIVDRGLLGR
jgi:AcrR family transcriptional regulator